VILLPLLLSIAVFRHIPSSPATENFSSVSVTVKISGLGAWLKWYSASMRLSSEQPQYRQGGGEQVSDFREFRFLVFGLWMLSLYLREWV
jgi:hypothetical protein